MSTQRKQIVILGAGYAGLMAALRLSGKTREQETEILLVNGSDTFIQRPRLHQGRVVVVGGGTTGIEGATEIKGLYPDLKDSLVTSGVGDARRAE